MVAGIHHLTLNVSDLERARAFYAGVLGLPVDQDVPGEKLRFRLGAYSRLVLRPAPPGEAFAVAGPGLDHISLGVPERAELVRMAEVLLAAGVATEGIHADPTGLAVLNFRDPDGIPWEFFEQP